MENTQTSARIHPLMAGATVSVMLVSLVGVAAITGILPNSSSTPAPTQIAMPGTPTMSLPTAPVSGAAATSMQVVAAAPAPVKEVVQHKTVVHHKYVEHRAAPKKQYAQTAAAPVESYPQPVYQPVAQPAPQPIQQQQAAAPTSGVGIAAGAVVGGLLANQIGGGNGRKLATVAGMIGGGYIGNEIEKRSR
jgi:uncharacterized protein YcfJ